MHRLALCRMLAASAGLAARATISQRLPAAVHPTSTPVFASSWPLNLRSSSTAGSGGGSSDALKEAGERGDLDALLDVVERQGSTFDAAAVTDALKQLDKVVHQADAPEQLRERLHTKRTFQLLADMAVSSASSVEPAALAQMAGILGRLRAGQMVLDELGRALIGGVRELEPHSLQQLVDGLRAADHSPGVLLLDAVSERLDALPPSRVDGEVVAAIRQSLAALGREDAHPVSSGGREPPPPLDRGGEASYT